MNRIAIAAFATAVVFGAGASAQQQDFSKVEVKTTDLGHRTYMLEGAGGNVTVAVADDGIIMVDSQFAPMHDKLKAAIDAIAKQPIKFLVNTHYHGDHSGGDEGFAKDGTVVVANENVLNRLKTGTANGLTGAKTPAQPPAALPTKTYKDALTLDLKGRKADLKHMVAAHTDGDTAVYFADANVLSTGDIVTLGRFPNIDFANGGSIKGMIAAVDAYIVRSTDATKVVPGHGPLSGKADLVQYRALLGAANERVAKAIADGKSEDDAVAAKLFADYQAKFSADDMASANFTKVVYRSLKG